MTRKKSPEQKVQGEINDYSVRVVFFESFFNNVKASSGTGFFVKSSKGPVFITNRHNLTGRDQYTEKPLSKEYSTIPNYGTIKIVGSHEPVLYAFNFYIDNDDQKPVWIEHPKFGSKADVIGILFSELSNIIFRFVDSSKYWRTLKVTDKVNIIGFPFGLNDYFAIWTTGFIASEPAVPYNGLPSFLIDARTRQGQSGSLVLQSFPIGHTERYKGKTYTTLEPQSYPIGIYSGRINKDSDIGIVWDLKIVRDIVDFIENNDVTDNKASPDRYEQVKEYLKNNQCAK